MWEREYVMGTRKTDNTRRRIKSIIKTFLLCNIDEKFTAKELSDWINQNHLGLGNHNTNPREITWYIRSDWNSIQSSILHEVCGEKQADGRYLFWLSYDDDDLVNDYMEV